MCMGMDREKLIEMTVTSDLDGLPAWAKASTATCINIINSTITNSQILGLAKDPKRLQEEFQVQASPETVSVAESTGLQGDMTTISQTKPGTKQNDEQNEEPIPISGSAVSTDAVNPVSDGDAS